MDPLLILKGDFQKLANPEKAKVLQRFFKTGKGEYGEGDKFLGITVPQIRNLVKKYRGLGFPEIDKLLHSSFHEERLLGLLIMVSQFEKGEPKTQEKIFNYYLANTKYINNWDLVDLTAPKIVGEYLWERHAEFISASIFNEKRILNQVQDDVLYKLVKSSSIWERRIAILATFAFLRKNEFTQTLKIAEILLHDKEDLIHKAVGWMLREVGKRNLEVEEEFLKTYGQVMPRTMLRYAIEKWDLQKKKSLIQ